MGDYGIGLLAGCETHTDWQYVTNEDNKFHNIFGRSQRTCGAAGHNINDEKINVISGVAPAIPPRAHSHPS